MSPESPRPRSPVHLGPFRLEEPIGRGGMGEVWRGVHRAKGVPVALKTVARRAARDPRDQAAFEREVRAAAALHHPCIVVLFDYGRIPDVAAAASEGRLVTGSPYLVMELASHSLAERVGTPWAWPELRRTLLQILDALAHAHAQGVIHRDIKPGNLLVFENGGPPVLKLADFGIAWRADAPVEEESAGSPAYMAPEQVQGAWRQVGPWTDLYALGCTAWALATGHSPFAHSGSVLAAQVLLDPGPFRPIGPVPPGFEAWLRTLLEKERSRRFVRAADAAWSLLQLGPAEGAPSGAPEPPTMGDLPTRHPSTVTLSWRLPGPSGPPAPPPPPRPAPPRRDPPPLPSTWRTQEDRPARLVGLGLALYGLRALPLAGREAERDALWDALTEVGTRGTTRCVLVRGPAGIGKTHLARWLTTRAHELGAATILKAAHAPQGAAGDGLAAMVSRLLRADGLDREALAHRIRQELPDPDEELIAVLGELLGGRDRGAGAKPILRDAGDVNRALVRLVHGLAAERPVVLWLDDVQWGPHAVALATALLDGPPLPVLILLTLREDPAEPSTHDTPLDALRSREETLELALGRLDRAAQTRLVRDFLRLEGSLAQEVQERTADVPLFAVQLIEDWIQRGILEAGQEGFRLAPSAELDLPESLHALWSRRVEHLLAGRDPADGRALELAAILGPTVDAAELRLACKYLEIQPAEDLVSALVLANLAVEEGETRWALVHGMLGESLVREARERGTLEAAQQACTRALYEKGVMLNLVDRALQAESPLNRALALAQDDTWRAKVRGRLASAGWMLGRSAEALEELDAVLAIQREVGDRFGECTSLNMLGVIRADQGRLDEARAHYEVAARVCREEGYRRDEGAVRGNLAQLMLIQGDMAAARRQLEEALATYRDVEDPIGVTRQIASLGFLHLMLGHLEEAQRDLDRALADHEESGNRRSRGSVLNNLGLLAEARGEHEVAASFYERALASFREEQAQRGESMVLGHLGGLLCTLDDLEAAEPLLRQALSLSEALGVRSLQGVQLGWLGLVRARRGDVDAGRGLLLQGERHLRETSHTFGLGELLCQRARVEVEAGDRAGAEAALQEAEAIAARTGAGPASALGRAIREARADLEGEPPPLDSA